MIDVDVISAVLKDSAVTRSPMGSEEDARIHWDVAYKQLNLIAARQIYSEYGYLDASLTKKELKDDEIANLADAFFQRVSKARASIPDISREIWVNDFERAVEARREQLLLTWEAKWRELCDGKKFIHDLHRASNLKISEPAFKSQITQDMRDSKSKSRRLVKQILEDFLEPASQI